MQALCAAFVICLAWWGGMLLFLSHSKDKSRKDAMSLPPNCQGLTRIPTHIDK